MKIATWNVERLKHYRDIAVIKQEIEKCDADILVLTETDNRLSLAYPFYYHTPYLTGEQIVPYADTENRVSIFSKFECVEEHTTYDENTAICRELRTDRGDLVVYGTIMGIFGNRRLDFKADVLKQMEDIRKLAVMGKNICVIGDYNLSFSDDYYFTKFGRDMVTKTFSECGLSILTMDRECCVCHIAISDSFIGDSEISVSEWNYDKNLSDHKGIMVELGGE